MNTAVNNAIMSTIFHATDAAIVVRYEPRLRANVKRSNQLQADVTANLVNPKVRVFLEKANALRTGYAEAREEVLRAKTAGDEATPVRAYDERYLPANEAFIGALDEFARQQSSATAAKETKTLIDDSVEQVQEGTRQVDRAGATMRQIVDSIGQVTTIVSEIAAASEEQSAGIEQVNTAIVEMDRVVQQNAALVEQAAAAADAMREQAGQLTGLVATFRLEAQAAGDRHGIAIGIAMRRASGPAPVRATRACRWLHNRRPCRNCNIMKF